MQTVTSGFNVDISLFYEKYHKRILLLSASYAEIASRYNGQLKAVAEQLEARRKSITVPVPFTMPVDKSKELMSIHETYKTLRSHSNDFSYKLDKEKGNARTRLRLQEVWDFCSVIKYNEITANIVKLENLMYASSEVTLRIQHNIAEKEHQLKIKRQLLSDEGRGAEKVNEYLNVLLGHRSVSLQAVEETNAGMHGSRFEIIRDGKRAYNLSESECNLIAFCYFLAKLQAVETIGKKPVIWIDDPIASLDKDHIYLVYKLLLEEIICKCEYEQLFISTYSLDFFGYFNTLHVDISGKAPDNDRQFFKISRYGESSRIEMLQPL